MNEISPLYREPSHAVYSACVGRLRAPAAHRAMYLDNGALAELVDALDGAMRARAKTQARDTETERPSDVPLMDNPMKAQVGARPEGAPPAADGG